MASRRILVAVTLGVLACLVASSALAATEPIPHQRIDIQAEVPFGGDNQSSLGSPASNPSTPVAPPTLQQIRQAQQAETVATLALPEPNTWRDLADALEEVMRQVGVPIVLGMSAVATIVAVTGFFGGGAAAATGAVGVTGSAGAGSAAAAAASGSTSTGSSSQVTWGSRLLRLLRLG